jgi:hypothetical protein
MNDTIEDLKRERELAMGVLRGEKSAEADRAGSTLVALAQDRVNLMNAYHDSRETYKKAWIEEGSKSGVLDA